MGNKTQLACITHTAAAIVLSLVLLLSACSGEIDEFENAVQANQGQMVGLRVDAPRILMSVGESQQLHVVSISADGAESSLDDVQWRVSSDQLATVSSEGLLTALADGEVEITAKFAGLEDAVAIQMNEATIGPITITPLEVDVCRQTPLIAESIYSDGSQRIITDMVDWSVLESDATLGNSESDKGQFHGALLGDFTISAEFNGVRGTHVINVRPHNLQSIEITASNDSLAIDETVQFSATGRYSTETNTTMDVTVFPQWSVDATQIGTVDTAGLFTAISSGGAVITAKCGDISSNSSIEVTQEASVTSIEIRVDGSASVEEALSAAQAESSSIQLFADFSDGRTAEDVTESADWSISHQSGSSDVASISNTDGSKGELTVNGTGVVNIKAVYLSKTVLLQLTIE